MILQSESTVHKQNENQKEGSSSNNPKDKPQYAPSIEFTKADLYGKQNEESAKVVLLDEKMAHFLLD